MPICCGLSAVVSEREIVENAPIHACRLILPDTKCEGVIIDIRKDKVVVSTHYMHIMFGGNHVVWDVVGHRTMLCEGLSAHTSCSGYVLGEWRNDGKCERLGTISSIKIGITQYSVASTIMVARFLCLASTIKGLASDGIYTIRQVGNRLVCIEVAVKVFSIFLRVHGPKTIARPTLEHIAVEAWIHDTSTHVERFAIGGITLPYLIHVFEIAEVVGNESIYKLLSPRFIAVARVHAYIVGKDDTCRPCRFRRVIQVVDDGGIGVSGIVAIAVTRRDFLIYDKGNVKPGSLRVGRSKVINPDDVGCSSRLVLCAEVKQLPDSCYFAVEVTLSECFGEVLHIEC